MAPFKPILGSDLPAKSIRPNAGIVPTKRRWAFSFRFWHQAENFGVGDKQAGWFISLLERLSEMSKLPLEEFLNDLNVQEGLRYHDINWNARNIPIERKSIDWVDETYRNNPEDYPFVQFHVSKAYGRVIGFFDEAQIFNIVLLDPMHNMQPSKYNDYQIRPTKIGQSVYSRLVASVERTIGRCGAPGCTVTKELFSTVFDQVKIETGGAIIFNVQDVHLERLQELVRDKTAENIGEILGYALERAIEDYESLRS